MVVPKRGEVRVRWEEPDIIEAVFVGYVTSQSVFDAIDLIKIELGQRSAGFFLLDASATSGYDPDVRNPGVALLRTLKERGVAAGACVAPSATVRMIGAAVSFVAALPIEFVGTRAQALTGLQRRRLSA